MTNKKLGSVLVGQLLVESGMLEKEMLAMALERAREMGVKIGEVLLFCGLVSNRDLKAALMAQRMLRQSLLSFKQAVAALTLVHEEKMDYESALARARWMHSNQQMHQFAKLLLDTGIVGTEQLGRALAISIKQGYALGRVLIIQSQLTPELRKEAIDAVILTRCQEITYEHAVAAMKAVMRTGHSIRDLLGIEASPLNVITDELILSGVLSEFEVVDIVEEALQRDALWKGTMVGSTLIAHLKFAASLSINRMLAEGAISSDHAQSLCQELLLSTAKVLRSMSQPISSKQNLATQGSIASIPNDNTTIEIDVQLIA